MDLGLRAAPIRLGHARAVAFASALAVAALGCSWADTEDFLKGESRLEVDHEAASPRHSRVAITDPRLTPSEGGRAVLSLALDNTTGDPLWVRLEIDAQRADDECEDTYGLKPGGHLQVDCPQTFKPETAIYTVEVSVFEDIGERHLVESATLHLTFGAAVEGEIRWD